jgi:hypothetical protein
VYPKERPGHAEPSVARLSKDALRKCGKKVWNTGVVIFDHATQTPDMK